MGNCIIMNWLMFFVNSIMSNNELKNKLRSSVRSIGRWIRFKGDRKLNQISFLVTHKLRKVCKNARQHVFPLWRTMKVFISSDSGEGAHSTSRASALAR